MSTVILFLITMVTLYANKGAVFEQRTSANHSNHSKAFEAAQGGVDFALAWLATENNIKSAAWVAATGATGAAWASDASYPLYDEKNTTSIAPQTIGSFTVSTTLWRQSGNKKNVEIVPTSNGDATVTLKQIVNILALGFNPDSATPWIVNGCISGITGNPSIDTNDPAGRAVLSSNTTCADMGHMKLTGSIGTFTGTAWDRAFSISKAEMIRLADNTNGPIYYYTDATVSSFSPTSLGTSGKPVILIFDTATCPKINGGPTIYGKVYCANGGDMQGWGNATIHGSLIVDSAVTKFTANADFFYDADASNSNSYAVAPIVSKITGSWRDF